MRTPELLAVGLLVVLNAERKAYSTVAVDDWSPGGERTESDYGR